MHGTLKEVAEGTPEEKAAIIKKIFMTREDLKKLTGMKALTSNRLWREIRTRIEKSLSEMKDPLGLPDTKHLPTSFVFKYLASYGIKRSDFELKGESK